MKTQQDIALKKLVSITTNNKKDITASKATTISWSTVQSQSHTAYMIK